MGGSARPGYQDSNYADLVKQIQKDLADRTTKRDEYLRGVKSVLPNCKIKIMDGYKKHSIRMCDVPIMYNEEDREYGSVLVSDMYAVRRDNLWITIDHGYK